VLLVFQARDAKQKEGWSATRPFMVEVTDPGIVSPSDSGDCHQQAVSYPSVAAGTVGRLYLPWTEGSNIILLRGRKDKPDQSTGFTK
jgi:hypothetical protein